VDETELLLGDETDLLLGDNISSVKWMKKGIELRNAGEASATGMYEALYTTEPRDM
jgi:hypothetical protein